MGLTEYRAKRHFPPLPRSLEPELCTLVAAPPAGDGWLHEIKFDGYRFLCRLEAGRARLLTRRGNDWTARLPAIAAALQELPAGQAVLDGEVLALDERGLSHFQTLQNALSLEDKHSLFFQAFDLLFLDGRDLRPLPLLQRKKELAALLSRGRSGLLRYTDHLRGKGPEFFAQACRAGLEGVVSKAVDSPYRAGRGRDWLKAKCLERQEFIVCGYTGPGGSRAHFGALLLAVREGAGLRYVGKVGTGFTEASLKELHGRLEALRVEGCPLERAPVGPGLRAARWTKPELVAEVAFSGWTADGRLRQPRFEGLREDKPAVKLTNPDRVLYPESGITKAELARYYEAVAERALPHVTGRPLAIVRCPEGRGKPCFYQKHTGPSMPPAVKTVDVGDKAGPHLFISDLDGLLSLVQMGALEIHPWGSRVADLERPDRVIFDLDPAAGLPWTRVVEGARRLRRLLGQAGLESFLKTTGGKGLHLVLPIEPGPDWETVKAFSKTVAEALARQDPSRYTAKPAKSARGGRIFIDYLRNSRGATAVAAYSSRARPGAPVSMPVDWDELGPCLAPARFHLRNAARRVRAQRRDPWERFWTTRQRLPS